MLQLGKKTNCKAVASYAIVPRRWVSHSESSRMVCLSSFRPSSVERGCLFLRHRQQKSIFVSLVRLCCSVKRPDGQSPDQPWRNLRQRSAGSAGLTCQGAAPRARPRSQPLALLPRRPRCSCGCTRQHPLVKSRPRTLLGSRRLCNSCWMLPPPCLRRGQSESVTAVSCLPSPWNSP